MLRASLCSLLVFMGIVALPQGAFAQVYKCTDKSGKIAYSDSPCEASRAGVVIEQKKTSEEIENERSSAAEALSRRQRERAIESEGSKSTAQVGQQAQDQAPGNSFACREAKKELDFVSSIRTLSQDEKRMRMNAVIAQVNASCGTNMPLMQEPDKVVVPYGNRTYPRGTQNK